MVLSRDRCSWLGPSAIDVVALVRGVLCLWVCGVLLSRNTAGSGSRAVGRGLRTAHLPRVAVGRVPRLWLWCLGCELLASGSGALWKGQGRLRKSSG